MSTKKPIGHLIGEDGMEDPYSGPAWDALDAIEQKPELFEGPLTPEGIMAHLEDRFDISNHHVARELPHQVRLMVFRITDARKKKYPREKQRKIA